MNLAISTEQFNINNVFYQDAVKNTIMNDSNFIRIIYSDENIVLNGICLDFNVKIINIDKSFNKFKCNFDKQINNIIIQKICEIEYDIIMKSKTNNKTPIFRISEQLKNGYIKVTDLCNMNNNKHFIIKISGIWTNEIEYGLTYKFIQCEKVLQYI